MSLFSTAAGMYDAINQYYYADYTAFLQKCFADHAAIPVREVLDLGCGTGGITRLLAETGFDMVGVDNSPEMLAEASSKPAIGSILYLCQDMRELDLYGTVQAAFSSFDCLNYLGNTTELAEVFRLVRLFTEQGGVFVFDLNTPYRYESVLDGNSFVFEEENDMLIWQNSYVQSTKRCRFYLSLFRENEDGSFSRQDELQEQICFSPRTVKRLLKEARFSVEAIYGNTNFAEPIETDEKIYFIAKAI